MSFSSPGECAVRLFLLCCPQLALWTVRQRIHFYIFFYQFLPLLSINYPCHLLEDLLSSSLTSWTICSWKMSFYLSLSSCAIFLSFSTFAFLIIFVHSQLHPVIFPFPSVSDIAQLALLPWSFRASLFRLIGLFNCCYICCWVDGQHTRSCWDVDLCLEGFEFAIRFLSSPLAQPFSFSISSGRREFILCH